MNKKFFIELNDDTYQKLFDDYLKVLKSPMYVTLETKPSFEEYVSSILVSYTQKIDEMSSFMNKDSLENMKKQMEALFGGASGLDDMFSSMFGMNIKNESKKEKNKDNNSKSNNDLNKLKS